MGRRQVVLGLCLALNVVAVLGTRRQSSSAVDSSSQSQSVSSRSCVYSFQVWTPNQDVLAKLRRLEQRCDAVRTDVDHEVRYPRGVKSKKRKKELIYKT